MRSADTATRRQGPLAHVRVLEFWGIGPAPFCGMMLADMGATVTCIRRPDAPPLRPYDFDRRGRSYVELDLKNPEAIERCLELSTEADVLIEGFRPGVMERLGLGPAAVHERNPALVYGRVTGWGQEGPYAEMAGHDLNYASVTGAIAAIGVPDQPVPPLNLIGDYGGGAMFLALGLLAALLHARETGEGQVIDAAMCDGVSYLMTVPYMVRARGEWTDGRGDNLLDGGAPYYRCYRCSDGEWISLAALEPRFFAELARLLIVPDDLVRRRDQKEAWPELQAFLAEAFQRRSRAEWCALLERTDVCFAPVLSMGEAASHPHNISRGNFEMVNGAPCPNPAPRFSRTPLRRHARAEGGR